MDQDVPLPPTRRFGTASYHEIKNVLRRAVPLWAIILIFGFVTIASVAAFFKFREIVYSYTVNLPIADGQVTTYTYGSWPALDNADFYNQVLDNFVAQEATFISVNLSTMQLQYYEKGVVALAVPILAKGRIGSWWETPAGLYKVQSKTTSEYSNFAHVYSPWALAFQGNFLIHGWPYYPGGTPVESKFSGGCIRLSTDDAKALYGMAKVGTPILVSSDNFIADNFSEQQQKPPVGAKSFLAADLKSNYVFSQNNPDEQLPIASITKLMTALVAVEYVNIENKITITPGMIVKTSIPRLKSGKRYSLYDLLQPLLKESSNEAAAAIPEFLGREYFIQLMNQKAGAIGMTHTHFVDSSGSDWGDVSTAHDLFILAQYLYNNRSFILKMTTNNSDPNVYGPSVFTDLQNFNVFSDDPDFVGGKVGMNGTASGTILSVFNEPFFASTTIIGDVAATSTVDRPIMFVVLGSNDYTQDAQNFLAWVRSRYR